MAWYVLLFAIFFSAISIGQYLFVSLELDRSVRSELMALARDIEESTSQTGFAASSLNQMDVQADQYAVVASDGRLLMARIRPELPPLLRNATPLAPNDSQNGVVFEFKDETGERWKLMRARSPSGDALLGVSENAGSWKDAERLLRTNIALFEAKTPDREKRNKVGNDVDYVVLDQYGNIHEADGRVPLRVARASGPDFIELSSSGRNFLIHRHQLPDSPKTVGASVFVAKDITLGEQALSHQAAFNAALAIVSWLLFVFLAYLYWNKKEEEKRAIREAFEGYFSPQILERILAEPEHLRLGGEQKQVTILFSDIRSFTSLTETLKPEELTRLLQEYFTEMTEAVFGTEGILDKYIGDAIMAFWGAPIEQPDQADRALRTATDMIRRLKRLQEKWSSEGYPLIDIGVGINSGIATVGNMGSTKRFDYTLIGDAVNAASRIEGLNKEFQSNIIISKSTKDALKDFVSTRDLGLVSVKGKAEHIQVYEVLSDAVATPH